MAADLQELVDDLAESLARPVALEDRRWRLLAFSAYTGGQDRVRLDSILSRAAPADVVAWLETLDLARVDGIVDTPANPAIGMGPRTCAPVRHRDVLLGYLWVIPGDAPLGARERAVLAEVAGAAADALWSRRTDPRDAAVAALLSSTLDDPDPAARARAAAALTARQRWAPDAGLVVAIATGEDAADAADRVRRLREAGDVVWRAGGDGATVVARHRALGDAGTLARALVRAGAACAATSSRFAGLDGAHRARADADAALLAVTHHPELGRAGAFDDLGAWPAVARLWDVSGRPAIPPPIAALVGSRHDTALIEALEATLDHAGDVAAAATALGVHRATLYRRLDRAAELTGLDLASGDDRLRAHLAVRMWRLGGRGPVSAPAGTAAATHPRR